MYFPPGHPMRPDFPKPLGPSPRALSDQGAQALEAEEAAQRPAFHEPAGQPQPAAALPQAEHAVPHPAPGLGPDDPFRPFMPAGGMAARPLQPKDLLAELRKVDPRVSTGVATSINHFFASVNANPRDASKAAQVLVGYMTEEARRTQPSVMELLNLAMEGVKVLSGNNTAHLAYRSLASELPQEMRGLYLVDEPHQKQEVPRDAAQQEQPLYKIRVPLASAAVAASAQGANASEPVPGIQQLPTLLRGLDKLAARASINTFAQFNKAVTDIRDIIHRQEFQAQLTWHAELDNKLEAISRLENVRDNPALHECILGLKTQG